jgi:hypothetical protein
MVRIDNAAGSASHRSSHVGFDTPFGVAFFAQMRGFIAHVIAKHDIDRLRARAAHYRHAAARAKSRTHLIYCRALARHLENEAAELERVIRTNAQGEPELVSTG